MATEKTYTYEILVNGEWQLVETTEDKERLLKHAHVAGVREVETKTVEKGKK